MNKKQVGAFLKVMSKDDSRPILCTAKVDRYKDDLVLVATDGYVLAAMNIDDDAAELEGKLIRRSAIERWYKLAKTKDVLTGGELVRVSADDYAYDGSYEDGKYPDWQRVLTIEPTAVDKIGINANFLKTAQDLDGGDGLVLSFNGPLGAIMSSTERGTIWVMPRKL